MQKDLWRLCFTKICTKSFSVIVKAWLAQLELQHKFWLHPPQVHSSDPSKHDFQIIAAAEASKR